MKGTFSHLHLSWGIRFDHLIIFLYGVRVESDSIVFYTSFILDYWQKFSSHICSHLVVDTFMNLEFLSYIQFFHYCLRAIWFLCDLCCIVVFSVLFYVSHLLCSIICIIGSRSRRELVKSRVTALEDGWRQIGQIIFILEFKQINWDVGWVSFYTSFHSGVHSMG